MAKHQRVAPRLPRIRTRKLDQSVVEEFSKSQLAHYVEYDEGMMVFHPALRHLPSEGFFDDPQECAKALRSHLPDLPGRYYQCCFATNREFCQGLDIHDLLETAAQDMFDDWQFRVENECSEEILIIQATLDAFHRRLQDFPKFVVDYSRIHRLPLPEVGIE